MADKSGSAWVDAVVEVLKSQNVPIPQDLDVIVGRPEDYEGALDDLDASHLLFQMRAMSEWVSALQSTIPEIQSSGLAQEWMRIFQASNSALFVLSREMNNRIAEAMAPVSAAMSRAQSTWSPLAQSARKVVAKKATAKGTPVSSTGKKASAKATSAKTAAKKTSAKATSPRTAAKKTTTKAPSKAAAKKTTTTKSAAKRSGAAHARGTAAHSSAETTIRGKKTPKKRTEIKPVKPQPGTAWGRKK